ncbi:MAG: hypothetical protein F2934_12865 [Actinobacteria bacterium]|uniref:Unannotated protein n=2 Tax=freshwater metagenome TaxID=449393 RepID=A0A6J7US98_9ZZZZ|nr:hypothetical protein [Actinomycetota bacterium]
MKRFSKKSVLLATGSAMIGGLGVGVIAVGTMANADSRPAIEQVLAGDSGVTGESGAAATPADRPSRRQHLTSALAPLVTDGTITEAQADKVITAIESAAPARKRRGGGPGLEAAATAIGITSDALRTELGTTKSLADVAQAHNVDVQKVIDALVADATKHIDQAVTDGKITAAQATAKKATLVERITTRVNTVGMPGRGPGGRHRGGHGAMGGDSDGAAASDAAAGTASA